MHASCMYLNNTFSLCITTHPINASIPFLASIVAPSAMTLVLHHVDAFSLATNLLVLAFFPTEPTILFIGLHINTFLLATVWTWATFSPT